MFLERSLKDAGDKISADIRTDVEQKLNDLKGVIQTATASDLKPKMDALSESLQKIGAAMYQSSSAPGGATEGQASPGEEPKTEDSSSEASAKDEAVEGEVVEEEKKE